mmetsp:Transcript_62022/g.147806  ORF Transcript_62022/g.147806 Transcript_62022/m.147806 type:complete len:878 (-) Transcript_62022:50-2683(-)
MAGGTEFTSRNGTNGVHGNGGDAGYASDASNGRAPRLVTHGSDHDGIQLDDGDDHLAGGLPLAFPSSPEADKQPCGGPLHPCDEEMHRGADDEPPGSLCQEFSSGVTSTVEWLRVNVYEPFTWYMLQRFLIDRFPVLDWLPVYTLAKFLKDLQAGLIVGMMLIPQGMGYADVAGLPLIAGLYSGFAPLIVYFFTGSSRQMGIGPVAIVSLLTAQGVPACNLLCPNADGFLPPDLYPSCPVCEGAEPNPVYWHYATTIALMSGIIQVLLGPLLGFVMNFVPHPVISGFTSAGGLIIAMSQLKDIMGYPIRKGRLHEGIYDFFSQLEKTNVPTMVMGVAAIIFLYIVKKLGQGKVVFFPSWKVHKNVKFGAKLPWAFIVVIVYILVTWGLRLDEHGVKITGYVPSGLPNFELPPGFVDNVPKLLSITIQIVIIGYLESIAVETKFATMLKYTVRPEQEAFAQGMANLVGGMTSCYPVVGSFSRSATNASYESQSPMCNLITGLVIMFTLLFLTELFFFLPKNVLAAIVIVAAVSLVDPSEATFLWKSSKKEFALLLVCFVITAFIALEWGIYISVALCGAEVLFKSTRPKVVRVNNNYIIVYLPGAAGKGDTLAEQLVPANLAGRGILIIRVEGDLNFSAASALKNIISAQFKHALERAQVSEEDDESEREPVLAALVFDLSEMDIVDTTALGALIALVEETEGHDIAVFITGVPPGLVHFLRIESVRSKLGNVEMGKNIDQVATSLKDLEADDGTDAGDREPLFDGRTELSAARYQKSLAQAVDAALHEDERHRNRRHSHDLQNKERIKYNRARTIGGSNSVRMLDPMEATAGSSFLATPGAYLPTPGVAPANLENLPDFEGTLGPAARRRNYSNPLS